MPKDTIREIDDMQHRLWMQRSSQERARFMFGMFATARRAMIESLPNSLSEREMKEQIYFRTYGEHLPEDFFKNEAQ